MPATPPTQTLAFEWQDPRPHFDKARTWSGIDYLRGYLSGAVPPPPIAQLIPMSLLEVEVGRVVFCATPGPQHVNTVGLVHGGFTATVLDSALGCAIHSTLAPGMAYSTAQLNIHYTRPILPETGPLTCVGRVVHPGRTLVTAAAELTDASGRLYAHGTTTCMVMPLSKR